MNIRKVTIIALLAVALAGCQTNGYGQKQVGGTLLGAGLGGLLGSQFGSGSGKLVATGLGVFAGGLLGNEIGRSLDRADRAYMYRATERAAAAPVGETITWRNPDSGNYGAVTPTREGVNNRTGAYCREYQTEVIVGGRRQHGYGQACRQADGSWKII
ncbi:MAG: glycine zipper 2TM domain-containing protein [Alphaproteobacteria bacterium]|nr:glycine zipper 2TM domain-containing protein [Alphaproteobacteria bacterium]